jgi:hypothetical protein
MTIFVGNSDSFIWQITHASYKLDPQSTEIWNIHMIIYIYMYGLIYIYMDSYIYESIFGKIENISIYERNNNNVQFDTLSLCMKFYRIQKEEYI